MIFATVGTHNQPFARFLAVLDGFGDDLVVQYGCNEPPLRAQCAEAFMPFERVLSYMRQADAVVTHAGVGSILCASAAGHKPVVVPRMHRLGEHVDDHQAQLTRALAEQDRVIALWPGDDLDLALTLTRAATSDEQRRETGLHGAVRHALRGD